MDFRTTISEKIKELKKTRESNHAIIEKRAKELYCFGITDDVAYDASLKKEVQIDAQIEVLTDILTESIYVPDP